MLDNFDIFRSLNFIYITNEFRYDEMIILNFYDIFTFTRCFCENNGFKQFHNILRRLKDTRL